MDLSFKKYAKLMNLKENTKLYESIKAIWENRCHHDWVESFRDYVNMVNFSPEHYTVQTRICIKCREEEELCNDCMGGGIIPKLLPSGHAEIKCEKCEGAGYV